MGSSSSVASTPAQTPRTSTLPSRARSVGFREVQLSHPEGASAAQREVSTPQRSSSNTPSHASKQSKQSTNMNQQRRQNGYAHVTDSEGFSDLSSVVGALQRERTMFSENDTPKYGDDEDMALETFYHQSGASYTCLYQGGQRFYLDSFESQDWHPFPQQWYRDGIIVTDRVIKENNSPKRDTRNQPGSSGQAAHTQGRQSQYAPTDDRAGTLDHPKRGQLQTYVFEEKRNVHYYFDTNAGSWVRLPITWELHTDIAKRLITPIQEALPDWTDKHDMLAALRASNYDAQECIGTYLTIGDQDSLATPKNAADAKLLQDREDKVAELSKQVEILTAKLAKYKHAWKTETEERKTAENQVRELSEQVSSLEVTAATATAQLEAMRLERPKTARPPSARPKTPVRTPEPENDVEPETVLAVNDAMKRLHKDYIKLKMEAHQRFEGLQVIIKQLSVGVMKISLFDNDQSSELVELRALYRKEALQRKLLYNKLQELRGNIRVFCRCRYDNRVKCCLQFPNDREVLPPGGKKGMKFDRVFTPQSTQDEVFEEARPIITSCVDGYNVSILAYGQTGSGKTFTMQGPSDNPGVNVRALKELFEICKDRENVDYTLKASMVEIYNETIQDLLRSDTKVLEIRANGNKIVMPGITEMPVEGIEDIEKIIKLGEKNRTTAATKMNSQSSRSHLIFMINIEGRDKSSGAVSTGTLTLCDLAGSERVGKTEAQGQRLVEAAAINKSLSSLGQVCFYIQNDILFFQLKMNRLLLMMFFRTLLRSD